MTYPRGLEDPTTMMHHRPLECVADFTLLAAHICALATRADPSADGLAELINPALTFPPRLDGCFSWRSTMPTHVKIVLAPQTLMHFCMYSVRQTCKLVLPCCQHCSVPTLLSANSAQCQQCSVPNTAQCQHSSVPTLLSANTVCSARDAAAELKKARDEQSGQAKR